MTEHIEIERKDGVVTLASGGTTVLDDLGLVPAMRSLAASPWLATYRSSPCAAASSGSSTA